MRRIKDTKIGDMMTRDLITVSKETTIEELQRLFDEHDFNAFPVTEGDKLVGIVTKLDFMKAFSMGSKFSRSDFWKLQAEKVSDVMRKAVVTVSPNDPVRQAIEYMIEFRLRSLPVVENSHLVGIVSRKDLIRCLITNDEKEGAA